MRLLRNSILPLACLVAGCGAQAPSPPPEPDRTIACALAGAEGFSRGCTIERIRAGGGDALIVRHPDGGFRRFALQADGTSLATADGAVEAGVAANGDLLDVRVGDDRYRFPYPLPHDATHP